MDSGTLCFTFPRAHARGLIEGDPSQTHPFLVSSTFRELTLAASLKDNPTEGTAFVVHHFPRAHARGLIEGAATRSPMARKSRSFRELTLAASLKGFDGTCSAATLAPLSASSRSRPH